jgi:hypothetical protein
VAAAQGLTPDELRAIALNGFRRGFGPRPFLDDAAAAADRAWRAWPGIS